MQKSRLLRLAALTQGAALVGSLGAAGCGKSSGEPAPPAMTVPNAAPANASADPQAASPSAEAPKDDAGALRARRLPMPNAPPLRFEDDAGKK